MSGRMVYAKLYFADFKADCEDLSNEEIGAYLRVLFEIYEAMGPVAFDERRLARRLNCRPHKARAVVQRLLDLGKLFLNASGQISNRRAEQEIAEFVRISVQNGLNRRSAAINSRSAGKKPNEINETAQRPSDDRPTNIRDKNIDNLQGSALSPRARKAAKPVHGQTSLLLPITGSGPRTAAESLADLERRQRARKGGA